MNKRSWGPFLALAGGVASALAAYVFYLRPRLARWGASASEVGRGLPGDDLVPQAPLQSTRAITIAATPETVWPWLVQLGYGRAGWYSYDFAEKAIGVGDFVDGHSARRIVPELQQLAIGDVIRTDPAGGMEVVAAEPARTLVLEAGITATGQHVPPASAQSAGAFHASWAFVLTPLPQGSCRLTTRFRCDYPPRPAQWAFARLLLEPAVFVMERKLLLGIKQRAEGRGCCQGESCCCGGKC
jgi:hypothetical protein